jgi:hypothetical protein
MIERGANVHQGRATGDVRGVETMTRPDAVGTHRSFMPLRNIGMPDCGWCDCSWSATLFSAKASPPGHYERVANPPSARRATAPAVSKRSPIRAVPLPFCTNTLVERDPKKRRASQLRTPSYAGAAPRRTNERYVRHTGIGYRRCVTPRSSQRVRVRVCGASRVKISRVACSRLDLGYAFVSRARNHTFLLRIHLTRD